MNIPKVLGTAFLQNSSGGLSFSVRKKIKKKKCSGEIAFTLINLFHVQIQEPASRSITTRAFVFLAKFTEFYYHKILETRRR